MAVWGCFHGFIFMILFESPRNVQRFYLHRVRGLSVTCINHTQFTSFSTWYVCRVPLSFLGPGLAWRELWGAVTSQLCNITTKKLTYLTRLFTYKLDTNIILICDLTSHLGTHGGNNRMRQSKWDTSSNIFVRTVGNCSQCSQEPIGHWWACLSRCLESPPVSRLVLFPPLVVHPTQKLSSKMKTSHPLLRVWPIFILCVAGPELVGIF